MSHPVTSNLDVAPSRAALGTAQTAERSSIRDRVAASRRVVVVFDDDPTGSQVVSDVPILLTWTDEDLDWAFSQNASAVFILTNTRSLGPAETEALLGEALRAVEAAASRAGLDYAVVCRGDSTLRGHFPLETNVVSSVMAELGRPVDGIVLVPAYLEAGRYTIDGTHYVDLAGELVPVGETEYARDSTFGFASSRLDSYVEERTNGAVSAASVVTISLGDLREGGVDRVAEILSAVDNGQVVAADAATPADLDVLVLGLLAAEERGKRFVYRSGPSFVAARVGMEPTPPLRPGVAGTGHGLVVVGSHVQLTSRQISHVLDMPGVQAVTLDVAGLIDPDSRSTTIAAAAERVLESLGTSDVVLMTSRELVRGADALHSLQIARLVSEGLVTVVQQVRANSPLAWVIAKGGITSHDVAAKGMGIRRAVVAGQLFPGMTSVWLPVEGGAPDGAASTPYVVFAGNVGDDDSIVKAVNILRGDDRD